MPIKQCHVCYMNLSRVCYACELNGQGSYSNKEMKFQYIPVLFQDG